MGGFQVIPPIVRENGDSLIWLAQVVGSFAALVLVWKGLRKLRPFRAVGHKCFQVVSAVYEIVIGELMAAVRARRFERYWRPLLEAYRAELIVKLDEHAESNRQQHRDGAAEMARIAGEVATLTAALTAHIATQEARTVIEGQPKSMIRVDLHHDDEEN